MHGKNTKHHLKGAFHFHRGHVCTALTLIGIALISLSSAPSSARAANGVFDWSYVDLDYARREKVLELERFCNRIHDLALKAAKDPFMIGCFDISLQFDRAMKNGPVPSALEVKIAQLELSYNAYFIENYFSFHDILFVNLRGEIVHSIRKQYAPNESLFEGDLSGSTLSKCLKKSPTKECFVDFANYTPSSEAAAFFVEPVIQEGVLRGWMVLQCAINKLNTIFAWIESLGQTGETFLVNRQGLMLTESNFSGDSTILKKQLDDRNIQAKFNEGQGHRTVTDYRGSEAFSSFQVVLFMDTRWLVVAKMDKDEVITQHYARHRRYYADKLLARLEDAITSPLHELSVLPPQKTLRIDMDEFVRAKNGERLQTFGVSTCTGLLATYPGRFGYMAHISPMDRIYGGDGFNLLGRMIKRIRSFDIYPSEKHRIRFMVVAPHPHTLPAIIDKLIEEGFLLSQILVFYNPEADSATISYDYSRSALHVLWKLKDHKGMGGHTMEDAENVGAIIRRIMQAEESGQT
ncbi:MAG: cache domain-containing protein [Desulfatibacillum sp.]|nr:cache domain-containing protein [Desulfatibacillum sp.]